LHINGLTIGNSGHNSNLATDINGLASADSQASPFLLLVDEPTEDERRLASAESIESSPSSEENEAAEEEQQDSLSEDSGELLFGKRTASRSRNSQAANGSVGHGELFTRMRGICARMPRLKRKRTPKPGSAESLVAFLCSNTNIF
jgi:hypothetical protein